jgi:hypothetical protein
VSTVEVESRREMVDADSGVAVTGADCGARCRVGGRPG